MRPFIYLALILGFTVSATANPARASDIHKFDVIGIKIGMKPEAVKEALKKHNEELNIEEYKRLYSYTDGVSNFNTDEVLGRLYVRHNEIIAPSRALNEVFVVEFSGTPGNEVVIGLKRTRAGDLNPPNVKDFVKLLTDKYGKFDNHNAQFVEWYGDKGTRNCFSVNVGSSSPLIETSNTFQTGDYSECRDIMTYSISSTGHLSTLDLTTPVTGYGVEMVSTTLLLEKDKEIQDWIDKLEKEATEKRASNVEAPKL